MRSNSWRLLAILVVLTLAAGCGDKPNLVKVGGTVTHKGQPVPNVVVTFVPEKGRASSGTTDAQGHFTLKFTRDEEGVVLGKHRVSVQYVAPDAATQIKLDQGKAKLPPEVAEVVAKYGDRQKSPYTVEVQKGEEIEVKLD
jgi:hypothetical protein